MAVLGKLVPLNKESTAAAFAALLPQFPAAGVTAGFDAGMQGVSEPDAYEIYIDMEKRGKLPMRIVGSHYHNDPNVDPLPIIESLRARYHTELVRAAVLKINVDGGDAQRTAAMLQPYADAPDTSGEPIFTPRQLDAMVVAADAAGIDCHFHAFGDRAVRMALDSVEAATKANPKRDRRHAVGHALYLQDDDVPRFAKLNAIAQMSIQWAMPDATNLGVSVRRLGENVVDTRFMRARSILDAGGRVAFGTDWPAAGQYSTYKPLEAIEVALTRKMLKGEGLRPVMPPERERLTLEQAIEANTLAPAYQIRMDDQIGSIEVGKLADLVVLERNLFDVAPDDISDVKVDLTMMNGKVVYDAAGPPIAVGPPP